MGIEEGASEKRWLYTKSLDPGSIELGGLPKLVGFRTGNPLVPDCGRREFSDLQDWLMTAAVGP